MATAMQKRRDHIVSSEDLPCGRKGMLATRVLIEAVKQ
jgi:hypothetical protein